MLALKSVDACFGSRWRSLVNQPLAKSELQALIGNFIQPFLHDRCCMPVFGQAYRIINNMHKGRLYRWDPLLFDELLMAAVLLSLAEANIRAPVSALLSATDATVA